MNDKATGAKVIPFPNCNGCRQGQAILEGAKVGRVEILTHNDAIEHEIVRLLSMDAKEAKNTLGNYISSLLFDYCRHHHPEFNEFLKQHWGLTDEECQS